MPNCYFDDVEDDPEDKYSNNVHEMFEKHDHYFLKDDDITDMPHPSRIISAFIKIASLLPNPDHFEMYAEHDIVYLAHVLDIEKTITEEDVIYLSKLGVRYDTETESLSMFC